jgi:hypothetical protein
MNIRLRYIHKRALTEGQEGEMVVQVRSESN